MASAADHRAAADAQFTGSNVFDDGASRGGPDTDSFRSSRIALIDGGLCEIKELVDAYSGTRPWKSASLSVKRKLRFELQLRF